MTLDGIADLSAVRGAFHETRWIAWNVVRAIASTVAFGCLAWALVLHGRTTPRRQTGRPCRQATPRSGRVFAERTPVGQRT